MNRSHDHFLVRRSLLRCGAAAALGSSSFRSALGMLAGAGISAAEAQTGAPAYRALVCVYLFGGNDGFNLLVPRNGAFYTQYARSRGNLAVPQNTLVPTPNTLLPLSGADADGRQFGLHPNTPELQALYESGKLAFVANLGTLLAPTSKADVVAGRNLPPNLFSHNDQQDQSMSSEPDAARRVGWGGRLAERLTSLNGNTPLSMNVSIAGNNRLQTSDSALPYVAGANGATRLLAFNGGSALFLNRKAAYRSLLDPSLGAGLLQAHSGALSARSMDLTELVDSALAGAPTINTAFPASNRLADQLRMVARLISARDALQMRRQVFFVSLSGFDTHDAQLLDHPGLLSQVSRALKAFYDATVELGVASSVTSFTMSDFGRTLSTNGDGSDHAWGNNACVLGGAVRGRSVYGRFPDLTIDGPDDAGRGRLIPTTSIDQYGASLSRWLGASESDLGVIFPHLDRFATSGFGFLS